MSINSNNKPDAAKIRLRPEVQRRLWEYCVAIGEPGKAANQTELVNKAVREMLERIESGATTPLKSGGTAHPNDGGTEKYLEPSVRLGGTTNSNSAIIGPKVPEDWLELLAAVIAEAEISQVARLGLSVAKNALESAIPSGSPAARQGTRDLQHRDSNEKATGSPGANRRNAKPVRRQA